MENSDFQLGNIKQPMPRPVEAQVDSTLPAVSSLSSLRVSDIRPGSPNLSKDGLSSQIIEPLRMRYPIPVLAKREN